MINIVINAVDVVPCSAIGDLRISKGSARIPPGAAKRLVASVGLGEIFRKALAKGLAMIGVYVLKGHIAVMIEASAVERIGF